MLNPLLVVLVISSNNAWGYIDPGSGHLLTQVALALVVGGMFKARQFFKVILSYLLRKQSCDEIQKSPPVHSKS